MKPAGRKVLLTAHVVTSVGWLGSIAAFAALAVVGLTHDDEQTVRGVYLAMEPAARLVLLPLAVAALVIGVVQGLLSKWGVFRHYWVVFKLAITATAAGILLGYMETFELMARTAGDPSAPITQVRNASPLLHATLAVIGLLVATVLAVFKPKGVTRYGRRKLRKNQEAAAETAT